MPLNLYQTQLLWCSKPLLLKTRISQKYWDGVYVSEKGTIQHLINKIWIVHPQKEQDAGWFFRLIYDTLFFNLIPYLIIVPLYTCMHICICLCMCTNIGFIYLFLNFHPHVLVTALGIFQWNVFKQMLGGAFGLFMLIFYGKCWGLDLTSFYVSLTLYFFIICFLYFPVCILRK